MSYLLSGNDKEISTANSFQECANICDTHFDCVYFSFSLLSPVDNCYAYLSGGSDNMNPNVDPTFDSGLKIEL